MVKEQALKQKMQEIEDRIRPEVQPSTNSTSGELMYFSDYEDIAHETETLEIKQRLFETIQTLKSKTLKITHLITLYELLLIDTDMYGYLRYDDLSEEEIANEIKDELELKNKVREQLVILVGVNKVQDIYDEYGYEFWKCK